MDLRDVLLIYQRELRGALRECDIVINTLLVPLFLYPLLLWGIFSTFTFLRGQEERFVSRLVLVDVAADHELRRELAEDGQVELLPADAGAETAVETATGRLRRGEIDAVVELLPALGEASRLDGNFRLRVTYDASEDRSRKARQRVAAAVDAYRQRLIENQAEARGLSAAERQPFELEQVDAATHEARGAFILGLVAPLLMIVMVAMGCYYPAVDTTAGERERSTWETLMTVAASRSSLVVGKYLYVATFGVVAGLLNLLGLTLSLGAVLRPILGAEGAGLRFEIPLMALPLLVFTTIVLALFLAAGMMLFAAFARTFKEGQSMTGPFFLFAILPPILVQSPDLELTPKLALVPIANVSLVFREALAGTFNGPLISLSFAVQVAGVVLFLELARRVLAFEDVMLGTYSGSFGKFLSQRILRRGGET